MTRETPGRGKPRGGSEQQAAEPWGDPPNGSRRAPEPGRKRRKGLHPRSGPCVASMDAAGPEGQEPPRRGF